MFHVLEPRRTQHYDDTFYIKIFGIYLTIDL